MPMDERATLELQRSVNRWAARIVPLFLICLIGYISWVFVGLLCVNQLLYSSDPENRHVAAGIVGIALYFVLLALLGLPYLRVLGVIFTNPGIVPGDDPAGTSSGRKRHGRHDVEKELPPSSSSDGSHHAANEETGADGRKFLDRGGVWSGRVPAPPGLDAISRREMYECDVDGLPRWCPTCYAWKPDRAHHSSEVGRCVYKMDHYCPWAGGVVAENNFKFFVQFCCFVALYYLYIIIFLAYFYSKLQGRVSDLYKIDWILTLAVSGLFFLFSGGMALNSINFVLGNTGTIDNMSRPKRTTMLAVYIPPSVLSKLGPTPRFSTITYPLGSAGVEGVRGQRTFAVLMLPNGANPYKLRSAFDNWTEVMGFRVWEWVFPVVKSPCVRHGRGRLDASMYPMGPAVSRAVREAGIDEDTEQKSEKHEKRERRRSRKSRSRGGRSAHRAARRSTADQTDGGTSQERS